MQDTIVATAGEPSTVDVASVRPLAGRGRRAEPLGSLLSDKDTLRPAGFAVLLEAMGAVSEAPVSGGTQRAFDSGTPVGSNQKDIVALPSGFWLAPPSIPKATEGTRCPGETTIPSPVGTPAAYRPVGEETGSPESVPFPGDLPVSPSSGPVESVLPESVSDAGVQPRPTRENPRLLHETGEFVLAHLRRGSGKTDPWAEAVGAPGHESRPQGTSRHAEEAVVVPTLSEERTHGFPLKVARGVQLPHRDAIAETPEDGTPSGDAGRPSSSAVLFLDRQDSQDASKVVGQQPLEVVTGAGEDGTHACGPVTTKGAAERYPRPDGDTVAGKPAVAKAGPYWRTEPANQAFPEGGSSTARMVDATWAKGEPSPSPRAAMLRWEGLLERLAGTVRLAKEGEIAQARIRLHPPQLGSLKVEAEWSGTLRVRLEVQNPQALLALESGLSDLRQHLLSQGLPLQELQLLLGEGSGGGRPAGGERGIPHRFSSDEEGREPAVALRPWRLGNLDLLV